MHIYTFLLFVFSFSVSFVKMKALSVKQKCCILVSCKEEGYVFWAFGKLETSESVEDVNDRKWRHQTGMTSVADL